MNMKQIIYAALLGAIAISCTQNELPQENPASQLPSVPLELTSASIPQNALIATRGAVPLTEGSVGLFLQGKETTTSYVAMNNCEYKYETSQWKPAAANKTIYLGGETANVYAYYPYNAAVTYNNKQQIPMTMQEYSTDNELYYDATPKEMNATPAKRALTLNLTHAYSQIELQITRTDYPNQCSISAITLKNGSLLTTGSINLTTGVVTGTTADYSLTGLPKILGASETYTRNLLALPSTLTADAADATKSLVLVLTVDTKPMTVKIPKSELGALVRGSKHVIKLKIKGTAIEPTVTTTDWDTKTLNGGNDYDPKPKP